MLRKEETKEMEIKTENDRVERKSIDWNTWTLEWKKEWVAIEGILRWDPERLGNDQTSEAQNRKNKKQQNQIK